MKKDQGKCLYRLVVFLLDREALDIPKHRDVVADSRSCGSLEIEMVSNLEEASAAMDWEPIVLPIIPRGGLHRKFLQEAFGSYYNEDFGGSNTLPAPPDMGSGQYAGTWGMQGGLVILMFGVCYMLFMLLKKRVCSFSIGWKDTDGGELELGVPRDA